MSLKYSMRNSINNIRQPLSRLFFDDYRICSASNECLMCRLISTPDELNSLLPGDKNEN